MIATEPGDEPRVRRPTGGTSTSGTSTGSSSGASTGGTGGSTTLGGVGGGTGGSSSSVGGWNASSINADLGVRIEGLGDAPPPSQPIPRAVITDPGVAEPSPATAPPPDITPTAADLATPWREQLRLETLAVDELDLRHI